MDAVSLEDEKHTKQDGDRQVVLTAKILSVSNKERPWWSQELLTWLCALITQFIVCRILFFNIY